MHREARRPRAVWIQLAAALVIAAVAVLSPHFAFTGLDEGTTVRDATTLTTTGSSGDRMGTATLHTTAASGKYALRSVTLNSGKVIRARWNPCQAAITYRVNLSGIPKAKRAALLKTVKASFGKLHTATGMTYVYKGSTTFVPKTGNLQDQPAEIVVAAVNRSKTNLPLTANSLGYGGVLWSTWYGTQGEGAAVVRGYVILEAKGIQRLKAGFGSGARQSNVILHELGHATGLDHVDNRKEQMYPTLSAASPSGYAKGDLAGLAAVGTKAGCIDIPDYVSVRDLN